MVILIVFFSIRRLRKGKKEKLLDKKAAQLEKSVNLTTSCVLRQEHQRTRSILVSLSKDQSATIEDDSGHSSTDKSDTPVENI